MIAYVWSEHYRPLNMELVEMGKTCYVYWHEATTVGQRGSACCPGWESLGKYVRIASRLRSPFFETPQSSLGKGHDGVVDTPGLV